MAIKPLCPFKLWTLQNFPFIAEDFDALTNYELMCKIVGYLNEVIDVTNEQTKAINELENWFNNLDVQDEINNKLDKMAEDGTLSHIINEEIFGELNEAITNLGNDIDEINDKINNKMLFHFPHLGSNNGDCYIMENGEKTYVVDLGRSSVTSNIVNYLVSKNLTKIDGVIITHYHGDHVGGGTEEGNIDGFESFFLNNSLDFSDCIVYLPYSNNGSIYNSFIGSARYIPTIETNIKNFLTNNSISYHEVETNEVININENTKITFYNADSTTFNNYYDILEVKDEEEVTVYNNFCTIFEVKVNNKYFLGTADIEEKAEEVNAPLLNNPDVVKIEHHGGNEITNLKYLEKIYNAKYGIVLNMTSYYANIYKQTTNAFNSTDKLFWLDDVNDDIIIKIENDSVDVVSKSSSSILPISYNNHIKALNGISVFPDMGTSNNLYENTDLDDLTEPSTYKSITDGIGTYVNVPIVSSFRLFVSKILDDDLNPRTLQIYVANNDTRIFIRKLTSSGWTTWGAFHNMGMGNIIANNSDLNDIIDTGKYVVGSGANSNTIANRPSGITSAPFVLEVEFMHDKRRLRQKLYNNVGEEYVRFMSGYNESTQTPTFTSWYKYTLTEVQ